MSESLLDRLRLDEARIAAIADSVEQVIDIPDPVGTTVLGRTLPNGIRLTQSRVPMGVIGAIYEARPNVTVDIAILALKAGNATILRGGSAAEHSNAELVAVLRRAVESVRLPADTINTIDQYGREGASVLMNSRDYVDLLIPRGGADLINAVVQDSIVPVIETGIGNVHMFIDSSATVKNAVDLVLNSKTQRPSVCNSLETLLVHEKAAKRVLPKILERLERPASSSMPMPTSRPWRRSRCGSVGSPVATGPRSTSTLNSPSSSSPASTRRSSTSAPTPPDTPR